MRDRTPYLSVVTRLDRSALIVALLVTACGTPASPSPTVDASQAAPSPISSSAGTPSARATISPSTAATPTKPSFSVATYPVPSGSHPHDVAPAADGGVWYTAQGSGELGWLDPESGDVREVALGAGSAPHGVIVGPDDAAWVTDGGLNAIVRVDPETLQVEPFPLPAQSSNANLNTAAFDGDGVLWFTGQAGLYGRLDPSTGVIEVFEAPRGQGPYGITATPTGEIYYSSLAGSYLGAVDRASGAVEVIDPPTAGAGLRRAWSDSTGRIWVSEWFAGQVGVYDPGTGAWQEWRLPGDAPQPYAVFVDETDAVWLTDFGANAIVRFDPATETFTSFPAESQPAEVRQLLGRPGEVWGAESAADQLVVVRTSDRPIPATPARSAARLASLPAMVGSCVELRRAEGWSTCGSRPGRGHAGPSRRSRRQLTTGPPCSSGGSMPSSSSLIRTRILSFAPRGMADSSMPTRRARRSCACWMSTSVTTSRQRSRRR
jgi:virginiamycin B lyase